MSKVRNKSSRANKAKYVPKSKKAELMKVGGNLADIIGFKKATRAQSIKEIWRYVKRHHLQDPNDKRYFTPDKNLSKVLGTKKMQCFDITRYLMPHLRHYKKKQFESKVTRLGKKKRSKVEKPSKGKTGISRKRSKKSKSTAAKKNKMSAKKRGRAQVKPRKTKKIIGKKAKVGLLKSKKSITKESKKGKRVDKKHRIKSSKTVKSKSKKRKSTTRIMKAKRPKKAKKSNVSKFARWLENIRKSALYVADVAKKGKKAAEDFKQDKGMLKLMKVDADLTDIIGLKQATRAQCIHEIGRAHV